MTRPILMLAAAAWLAAAPGARADTIITADGRTTGQVTKITATEVTVEQAGITKAVPVNQIESIYFEDEPFALRNARTGCDAGRYAEVLEALERLNVDEIQRPEIKQDIAFYKALATGRAALGGSGKVLDAARLVKAFLDAHPNSFHYFEACELMGELAVAAGSHSGAVEYFGRLAKAPWPDYKMRAGVAIGRAYLNQGKPQEAQKTFQGVLELEGDDEAAQRQRTAARLGLARCLAETSKPDEAIKLASEILDKSDAEQADLNAQAYNVLGIAHRKAGRPKDALWAFLHVDILYPSETEAHVEALKNLIPLWKELQKPERAAEAERILKEQDGRSP